MLYTELVYTVSPLQCSYIVELVLILIIKIEHRRGSIVQILYNAVA